VSWPTQGARPSRAGRAPPNRHGGRTSARPVFLRLEHLEPLRLRVRRVARHGQQRCIGDVQLGEKGLPLVLGSLDELRLDDGHPARDTPGQPGRSRRD
jgi:hypothetical protein